MIKGCLALSLPLLSVACATDLGLAGGTTLKDPHGVLQARAAVETRVGFDSKDAGVLVGGELEGRSEWDLGSRWNAGVMVGWGHGPVTLGGKFGYELFASLGVPMDAHLFSSRALYTGAGFALPISLERARNITDMNRTTWILRRRLEVVPMARYRYYLNSADSPAPLHQHELSLVLSLRLRFESDLY
jgi:hypothetical protein